MNIKKRKKRTDPFMLDIQIRAATGRAVCIPVKRNGPSGVPENLRPSHGSRHTGQLSLPHALRVLSAEYWLSLGEPDQAFRELELLPNGPWGHPLAVKVRVAALGVLGDRRVGQCEGKAAAGFRGNSYG